jgi:ferric-dicitrate binding protein FerR (iron transport regulator)
MNSPDDRHGPSPELPPDAVDALDALRQLPRERAPEALRASVRRDFLASAAERTAPRKPTRSGPRPWARLTVVAAGIAAAFILFFYGASPREPWVVVDLLTGDEIRIEGAAPVIGAEFDGGSVSTTPSSEVEFALEERLRLRFLADARAELPPGPGRWFGRSRTLRIEQGEVYGSTGGEGLGFELVLETGEAKARIIGTTFAAIRLEDATCFCLFSGRIEFVPAGSTEAIDLPEGQRVFIYRDGRPPLFEDLTDRERMKLQMIEDVTASQRD